MNSYGSITGQLQFGAQQQRAHRDERALAARNAGILAERRAADGQTTADLAPTTVRQAVPVAGLRRARAWFTHRQATAR